MRVTGILILACAPFLLLGCGKKSNADLIVGTWEVTKGEAPPGSTMQFTKDGKLKATMKVGDKDMTMDGTYKLDGDKITVAIKAGPKEISDTGKIKTLNDTTLIVEDDKGKLEEYKRKS